MTQLIFGGENQVDFSHILPFDYSGEPDDSPFPESIQYINTKKENT